MSNSASGKQMRLNDIAKVGTRTDIPCMRCLNAIKDGILMQHGHEGCVFPDVANRDHNELAWSAFEDPATDEPYKRCEHCLIVGQDCLAPPDGYLTHFKRLRTLANAFYGGTIAENRVPIRNDPGTRTESAADTNSVPLVEETIADAVARDMTAFELAAARTAYIDHARSLYLVIDEKYRPHALNLFAHSGVLRLSQNPRTTVQFKGRDRSKGALLAKEKEKKRDQERREASDAEEDYTPRKKTRFNVKSRGVAPEEVAASEAVALTEYNARLATYNHYMGLNKKAKAAFTKANGKPAKPTLP